ncbi:hypothetical protein LTR53_017082, partial [Teratosphaeriaceae sp. CCFEE 6253]
DRLLLLSPSTADTEPLLVLEFLHRVADALEEFLGAPLLASRIVGGYDVVAQVLAEVADGGVVCQGEANALRDVVETGPGVLNNLLGKVGLPGNVAAPGLLLQGGSGGGGGGGGGLGGMTRPGPALQPAQSAQGSAIPWRRGNVRHTSNELYVDIVETLAVTLAPSGRPLAAFAHGSVAFTAKVSGVPDLLLSLSTGGKGAGMGGRGEQVRGVMQRTVFHPCVRLSRWKGEGVMSFVPPDGRFALCGYEVDLMGAGQEVKVGGGGGYAGLGLPVGVEVTTGLGSAGLEFEVRISPPNSSGGMAGVRSAATASLQSNLGASGGRAAGFKAGGAGGGDAAAKGPAVEGLGVRVPLPGAVRNVTELRPSKGEAHWNPADGVVEWHVPARDFGPLGAVLRCTVQGPAVVGEGDAAGGVLDGISATTYDYDEGEVSAELSRPVQAVAKETNGARGTRGEKAKELMPTSATLSFGVKGWLASGLRVESLVLDNQKSRGLGAEVKPYKGVKYLTVSRDGIEVRC